VRNTRRLRFAVLLTVPLLGLYLAITKRGTQSWGLASWGHSGAWGTQLGRKAG